MILSLSCLVTSSYSLSHSISCAGFYKFVVRDDVISPTGEREKNKVARRLNEFFKGIATVHPQTPFFGNEPKPPMLHLLEGQCCGHTFAPFFDHLFDFGVLRAFEDGGVTFSDVAYERSTVLLRYAGDDAEGRRVEKRVACVACKQRKDRLKHFVSHDVPEHHLVAAADERFQEREDRENHVAR